MENPKETLEFLIKYDVPKAILEKTGEMSIKQLQHCLQINSENTITNMVKTRGDIDDELLDEALEKQPRLTILYSGEKLNELQIETQMRHNPEAILEHIPHRIPPTRLPAMVRRNTEICKRLIKNENGNKLLKVLFPILNRLRPAIKKEVMAAIASKV